MLKDSERTVTLEMPDVEYLYRLSYDPQRPNRLLVSGQTKGGGIFSWAYAPGMDELVAVTDNGTPAYKCALWDGQCFYAERLAGFEERRIVKAEHLEYTHLDARTHVAETIEYEKNTATPEEFE